MPVRSDPFRILILSNEDSTWTPRDYAEVDLEVARMQNGLIESGYQVEVLTVLHSVKEELGRQPRYSPDQWLVINWCEQYIDRPWTDAEIAQELEDLGYVFTGASGAATATSRSARGGSTASRRSATSSSRRTPGSASSSGRSTCASTSRCSRRSARSGRTSAGSTASS